MADNKLVSDKIRVLRAESVPEKQSVAIALSMNRAGRLRSSGVYIRKGSKASKHQRQTSRR